VLGSPTLAGTTPWPVAPYWLRAHREPLGPVRLAARKPRRKCRTCSDRGGKPSAATSVGARRRVWALPQRVTPGTNPVGRSPLGAPRKRARWAGSAALGNAPRRAAPFSRACPRCPRSRCRP